MATPLPPLPAALTDPKLPVWIASALWLAGSLVLGGAHLLADRPLDVWFWTTVAGWALGSVGFGMMAWQRSAARRGSRSAQPGFH
jgi:Protein of unknown function (DUF2530)